MPTGIESCPTTCLRELVARSRLCRDEEPQSKETNEGLQVELKYRRQKDAERRTALKTHADRRAKFISKMILGSIAGPRTSGTATRGPN